MTKKPQTFDYKKFRKNLINEGFKMSTDRYPQKGHKRREVNFILRITIILQMLFLFLLGCGMSPVVMVTGELTHASGYAKDSISLLDYEPSKPVLDWREDIKDKVCEVGKSLGYRVVGRWVLDQSVHGVTFTRETSSLAEFVYGGKTNSELGVHIKDNKLEIVVRTSGRFGTGDQKYAEKLLNEFKEKLLAQIKK